MDLVSVVLFLIGIVLIVISLCNKKKEENTVADWLEKYLNKIFIFLFLLAIIVRIIALDEIPKGIHVDEAGMAYDAYCLANYGVDRHLNPHPVYLIGFSGGQSAMYAYLTSFLISLFGLSIFAIRLPIVIFSLLAILCSYFLVKDTKNKKMAILVIFLLAICPWHIMQSRWGLDCNLLSSFFLIAIFALTKAKKTWGYILAGIAFGLALYTYILSYIMIPLFLLFTLGYLLYIKKIKIRHVIAFGIPLAILALPLLYMVGLNNGLLPKIEIPFFSIPEMMNNRIGEISLKHIWNNIPNMFTTFFIGDNMIYNVPNEFGTLYYISIPFAVIGFGRVIQSTYNSIKKKEYNLDCIILFLFLSVLITMLVILEPKVNKINPIYLALIYFTATGILYVTANSKKILICLLAIYTINFGLFNYYYFYYFINVKSTQDIVYQAFFDDDISRIAQYINSKDSLKDKEVYIRHTFRRQLHIYTLLQEPISPYDYRKSETKAEFNTVVGYGKYHFYVILELYDDCIYVFDRRETKITNMLLERGFVKEDKGEYKILYKEQV